MVILKLNEIKLEGMECTNLQNPVYRSINQNQNKPASNDLNIQTNE